MFRTARCAAASRCAAPHVPRNPHASWSLEPLPPSFVCAVQTAECSAPPAHSRPQGCEKQGNFGPAKPDILLPFAPPGCSHTPLFQESLRAALEFYITSPVMEQRLIRGWGGFCCRLSLRLSRHERFCNAHRSPAHVDRVSRFCQAIPPPSLLRTNRTRRVPHPVLIGHAASPTPY